MKQGIFIASITAVVAVCATAGAAFFHETLNPQLPLTVVMPDIEASADSTESASAEHQNSEIEMLCGSGVTWFLDTAMRGDAPGTEAIFRGGMDINARDGEGRTALFCAAAQGRLSVVKTLLAAHANVNACDREGRTPLMAAAAAGEPLVMRQLLDGDAILDAPDASGRTALHYAIAAENLPATKFLIEQGASCTLADADGRTAVALALESGNASIVKSLLDAQPATLSWDEWSRDALAVSIENGDRELARLLLSKHPASPSLSANGEPLLACAVAQNDLDQLRFLLDCGADPNVPLAIPAEKEFVKLFHGQMMPFYLSSEPGMTPLMIASGLGRVEMVQALIEHGAKRNAETKKGHLIALYFAAWADSAPSILALLGKDPRLDAQPNYVEISLKNQRANFFKNGALALSSQVSTGKPGHSTPTGYFVITDKQPSHRSTIYKVEMPFFMRLNCREFGMHQGVVPNYPASHGCIRMPGEKARELYKQVEVGTLVTIVN